MSSLNGSEGYRFVVPDDSSPELISAVAGLSTTLNFAGEPTVTESELGGLLENETRYLIHITLNPSNYGLAVTQTRIYEGEDKLILYVGSENESNLINSVNVLSKYASYQTEFGYDCVEIDYEDIDPCVPEPYCGDGIINNDEQCDGSDLGGKQCIGLGYTEGTLLCDSDCEFDILSCINQTCTDTCTSLGYECGMQIVCEESTDCGTCDSGNCLNGICEKTCIEGWKCKGRMHKAYQLSDCSWVDSTKCENGCLNGECISNQTNQTFKGYIIQFRDKPVLEERAQKLKDVKNKKQKDNLGSYLNSYQTNLKDKNNKIKNKIKAKLNKHLVKGYATQKNEVLIMNEFSIVFNGIALDISEEEALELKELDEVKEVYPNYEVHATLMDSVPLINADDIWLLDANGDDCSVSGEECLTGEGVTIAIIDTGVDYTHADLGGCFGVGCKVVGGYDFANDDNDPMDDHGHGTHVAGTAAGNGVLKGVAPDAKIYAYKVLDSGGYGDLDGIIAAIERAVDPNQDYDYSDHVDVISMSLGANCWFYGYPKWCGPDDPASQAIDTAVKNGVIAVIAAGNDGPFPSTIGSPGTARKAITVGATDKDDILARFSSRGPIYESFSLGKPDLVAPGVDICAAQWDNYKASYQCLDDEHTAISGTSMATPHVAGAAALLLQKNPTWTPSEVKNGLKNTAVPIEAYSYKNVFSDGSRQPLVWSYPEIGELCTRLTLANDVVDIKVVLGSYLSGTVNIARLRDDNEVNPGNIILEDNWVYLTLMDPEVVVPHYYHFLVGDLQAGTYWFCSELESDLQLIAVTSVDDFFEKEYHNSDGLWHTIEGIDLGLNFFYSEIQNDPNQIGKGRIDVSSAVQLTDTPDVVELNTYGWLEGVIDIGGTVTSNLFQSYTLKYRHESDSIWIELVTSTSQVSNGILYENFDVGSLNDGGYILNLTMTKTNGDEISYIDYIVVDNIYISSPEDNEVFSADDGIIDIVGTARLTNFQNYEIKIGMGDEFYTIGITLTNGGNNEIIGDILGTLDLSEVVTSLGDGSYTLKLIVYGTEEETIEDGVTIGIASYLAGWPVEFGGIIYSSPSIGDIDNDGDLELVIGGGYGINHVYVFNHDGTLFDGNDDEIADWPIETSAEVYSSPALADIDGDGDLEIFVGNEGGRMYAWHHDGTPVSGDWHYQTSYMIDTETYQGSIYSSPAIGDVDGDSDLEIVFGVKDVSPTCTECNQVYVLNSDGTLADGWPKSLITPKGYVDMGIYGTPSLADLDNDGDLEIIVGTNFYHYVWNYDGTLFDGNNDETPDWPQQICLQDLCGEDPTGVNTVGGFRRTRTSSVGDINNDGDLEIVTVANPHSFDSPTYRYSSVVHVFKKDGTELPGFPLELPDDIGWSASPPSLADINGDGYLEIVLALETGVIDGGIGGADIIIIKYDGTYVWPKEFVELVIENEPSPVSENGQFYHARGSLIADIDGDNDMEIVVAAGYYEPLFAMMDKGRVFAFHHDGTPVLGFPKFLPHAAENSILSLTDLDQDGDIELVGGFGGSSAGVYVLDLLDSYDPSKVEWGMFAHDVRHTGVYTKPISAEENCETPGDEDNNGLADCLDTVCEDQFCNAGQTKQCDSGVCKDIMEISSCQPLNQPNTVYVLQSYITGITEDCFVIGANGVTLDFNGFSITGDANEQDDYGVYSSGYDGVTIKNGYIYNFGSGIITTNGDNWNIIDMTITTDGKFWGDDIVCDRSAEDIEEDGDCDENNADDWNNIERDTKVYGMYLDGLKYSFVMGNDISNMNHRSEEEDGLVYGMYFNGGSDNLIQNNVVSDNGGDSARLVYGMYFNGGSDNTIQENVANNNGGGWVDEAHGMYLSGSNYNIIQDNAVAGNYMDHVYGISLINSDYNDLISNIVSENDDRAGISLINSNYNDLISNNANLNGNGISLSSSLGNTLTSNIAGSNDYGIRLYSNSNGNTLTSNIVTLNNEGGIYLRSSSNGNTLTSNTVNSNEAGILLESSSNNIISDNTVTNSNDNYGISLFSSSGNTLTNNAVNSNEAGIGLSSSSNNLLQDNTVTNNNDDGISLDESSGNTLTSNTVNENGDGIRLSSSSDNNLINNIITSNQDYGIEFTPGSDNNKVYCGTFSGNWADFSGFGGSNIYYGSSGPTGLSEANREDYDCDEQAQSQSQSLSTVLNEISSTQDFKLVIGANAASEDNIAAIDIAGPLGIEQTITDNQANINDNIIVIGGSCANTIAAELRGNLADCAQGFEEGKGMIKVFNVNGKTQILVAGYDALDTRIAAQVIVRKDEFELDAGEVITYGTGLSDVNVE